MVEMLLTVFVCTRYWPEPLKPKPLRAANKRFDCFAFRLCKHWKRNSEYLAVFCRWFWIHNIHIHIHVLAHHFHLVWRTRCCWLSQAISFLIFMQNYRLNTCYTFTVELALALLFLCSHKKAISNQNLQFCHSFVVFALVSLETPFILLFKRIVGCFPLFSKANQIMKRTLFRLSLENKRVHSLTACEFFCYCICWYVRCMTLVLVQFNWKLEGNALAFNVDAPCHECTHIKKRHKFPFARIIHKLKHHFSLRCLLVWLFLPKHSTIIILLNVHYNFLFGILSLYRANVIIMLLCAFKWLLFVFQFFLFSFHSRRFECDFIEPIFTSLGSRHMVNRIE